MVDVSVVVCTYNRAESLRDTIESLTKQKAGSCSYEIIVVDNNSKDHTKSVTQSFNGKVKYLFESKQGLSYARNTGIREAKGQVIAFTDDDVIADPNWVESLQKCFRETKALMVAGKIERLWNCERPQWLADEITGPLIVQDLGPVRKKWDLENRHTVGANMAFHRSVFERYGTFQEELGRKGDSLIGGEDREIFKRLFADKAPIFYEPEAIVHHKVEKERLSKDYMKRWFWDIGKTLGHGIEFKKSYAFTIAPLWLWKKLIGSYLRYFAVSPKPDALDSERFTAEIWARHYTAIFVERFAHWLPFNWGSTKCIFHKEVSNDQK